MIRTVANLVQGVLAIIMAVIYFQAGNRLGIQIILVITFSISLFLMISGVSRRKKIAEVLELYLYFFAFSATFIGLQFDQLSSAEPIGNWFWVVWGLSLIFNLGEYIASIILKLVEPQS